MKSLCLVLLLISAVLAEKKINLEDIERDQLRSEINGKKTTKSLHTNNDTKYSTKAEVSQTQQQQQGYHGPTTPPQELGNQAQPQAYSQGKYPENDEAYLQQAQQQQQQQLSQQDQQYYVQEGRGNSHNDYDALQQQQQQQQLYQQEILVGNQLQTVQQKAAAQKYNLDGSDDKATYYVNIPMSQLLAYYQNNYGYIQPKSSSKSADQQQQISIPLYMPLLAQNQVYAPTKVTYMPDIQYVPTYPTHTQAVFSKTSKTTSAASAHTSSAATSTSPVHQLPAANHQQYAAPLEILANPAYTQAVYKPQKYQYYITHPQQPQQYVHQQQQPQQQQQYDYENQAATYGDIYNAPATAYVQDNAIYEQQQQQQQQYYVPTALAEQLVTQILHQTGIQSTADVAQHHVKHQQQQQEAPVSLQHEFTAPQYQAQKFRASHEVSRLVPVSTENEGFPASKSIYSSVSSQPKTLLDSYVPSHIIAAQDANRYRERPIKLESGFLPSKINFVRSYKKRKTE